MDNLSGLDLARALAGSERARAYTQGSRDILQDPKRNRTFATEDSFLGYAIHDLLPEDFKGITLAKIDRFAYTSDQWGFFMRPSTIMYHDKMKSAFRMRAAYVYAKEQSCATNVSISCSTRNPNGHYAQECSLRPSNKACSAKKSDMKRSKYFFCQVFSIAKLTAINMSQQCVGIRGHGFNGTHDQRQKVEAFECKKDN